MKFVNLKKISAFLPATLLCCLLPQMANSAIYTWNSPEADWDSGNTSLWLPNTGGPGAGDDVRIINGGLAKIVTNVAVRSVTLGSSGVLDNRLEIATGSTLTNTANGVLGSVAGSFGTATVSGTWALGTAALNVGAAGTGSLTIQSGGRVTNAGGNIGNNAGGSGTAQVMGEWSLTGALGVGASGTGSLTIATGGKVTSSGATIGNSGTGEATVSGSWTYTGANFTVGGASGGRGTLTIENGGKVSGANIINIGSGAGATGEVTIKSGGLLEGTSGAFTVGNSGTGTLTVQSGGNLVTVGGNIGTNAGAVGSIVVSGTWTNSSSVYVGARSSGQTGAGTLEIGSGGKVTNTAAYIGGGSGGTLGTGGGSVTVKSNGFWESTSLQVGVYTTGTLTVATSGTVKSTTGSIGEAAGSSGSASIAGLWDISGSNNDLSVGSTGTGSLIIEEGGIVKNKIGYIGRNATGNGSVVVKNSALWENSGAVRVGNTGAGSLLIESGGTVTGNGSADIGFSATTGSGVATVRGTWTVVDGDLNVGYSGAGALTVGESGLVDVNAGAGGVYLARANNAAKGTLNIGGAVVGGVAQAAEAAGVLNAALVEGRTTAIDTPTLNFNHTGTDYVFANSASEGIAINNKVAVNVYAGTTILTAASTYTAGTEIFGGTLVVDNSSGSGTGTGAVTVRDGGTLRGSGSIQGAVTLDEGATLAAGNSSTGTLDMGSLLWNGGAEITLRLGESEIDSDFVNVLGLFAKGDAGAFTFNLADSGSETLLAGTTYALLGYGSKDGTWNISDFNFTYSGTLAEVDGYFSFDDANQILNFTVTNAIPEPTFAALFGLAAGMLYLRRRTGARR